MMECDFDIGIIGGGCMGTSIAYELLTLGFRNIVLVDKGCFASSATLNSGAMIRIFHENVEHIKLALANYKLLGNMQKQGVLSKKEQANGSLYFFHRNRFSEYKAGLEILNREHYPFEVIDAQEGSKRFPMYEWKEDELAIYEPLACQLEAREFVENLQSASQRFSDFTLLDAFEVKRMCSYRNHYVLCSEKQKVSVKTLILAGGASLLSRLQDLGLRLELENKKVASFRSEKTVKELFVPNFFDRETLEFGGFGRQDEVVLSSVCPQRVLETFWYDNFQERTADDCYAPNRLGMLGQVPGHSQLFIAMGWGGTGFKFALEVAKRMGVIVKTSNKEMYYGV